MQPTKFNSFYVSSSQAFRELGALKLLNLIYYIKSYLGSTWNFYFVKVCKSLEMPIHIKHAEVKSGELLF